MRIAYVRKAALLLLAVSAAGQRRALTIADFDAWRHIQNQILSNDGHYLAYALFPQQGDGELVVRDLKTGHETRAGIGELPPPPAPDYSHPQREEAPPEAPGIAIKFTADGRFVVSSTFPTHDAVETAKRERLKAQRARLEPQAARTDAARRNPSAELPPGDLVLIDLSAAKTLRIPRVRNFQLPTADVDYVAYEQLPEDTPVIERPSAPDDREKQRRKPSAGDLLLRNLQTNKERRFAQVGEYTFLRNGKALIYSVSVRGENDNGVYLVRPGEAEDDDPDALLSGAGRYEKLAWDEDQTRLAFLSDHDHAKNAALGLDLYAWTQSEAHATKLQAANGQGIPDKWQISDKASLTISKGGQRIFFGTAPAPPTPAPHEGEATPTPDDERVSVDLWSWKDDYIQPMQKIRARSERARTYRAVYDLTARRCLQLSDPEMNDLLPSDDGAWAIGNDDRAFRRIDEYDTDYVDSYAVNVATGERKLLLSKHPNRLSWSPSSRYAIYFDGKDWISVDVPGAKTINLTAKLGVSFANEQNDIPGFPAPYRLAGWTRDSRFVVIYDRFDIWKCAPDGSSAVNLTQGAGRKNHLEFRLVRFVTDDPESRWINPAERMLLRTENDQTRDSGFYETTFDAAVAPRKLVFASKNFANPIKARNAEVYVTAASTFSEYPDLLTTDASFHSLTKVTDADPQLSKLLWGTAELVSYTNTDGHSLQAILYKPADFDPHKKYPMLVYIYERLTQNFNNFIEPKPANIISPSFYASNGYIVLEPDIEYKTGYPGESALNCVLPAIQSIVNRGFVDEHSIGIQGHSWGGYQIAYMITRTNRFRAAQAGAPVADMISAYDSIRWGPGIPRQFQYEKTQSRIGGTLWQYPLRYIENSPVFAADRVQTPVLMMHNDADDAVPWYQGIEFYLALRRLNKEVYMFDYNGEPHNLRRRANQKDFTLRTKEYFDYYLKGEREPDWMTNGIPYLEKAPPPEPVNADQ